MLVLNSGKQFNTGLMMSDRVFIGTALECTDVFFVYTVSRVPETSCDEDCDTLGQRSTASGSAKVAGLHVPWMAALGFEDQVFVPQPANISPRAHPPCADAGVLYAARHGALDKAIGYAKDHGRAWLHSPASGSARRPDTS